jgi:hypothetical protein
MCRQHKIEAELEKEQKLKSLRTTRSLFWEYSKKDFHLICCTILLPKPKKPRLGSQMKSLRWSFIRTWTRMSRASSS